MEVFICGINGTPCIILLLTFTENPRLDVQETLGNL